MISNADHASEASDEMLRTFLRAQRESVLAILEGLSEEAWHRSVVPTGWTPAGMLEHLGGAEWHWFQGVVAGKQPELPGDVDEDQPPYDPMSVVFTTDASQQRSWLSTATSVPSQSRSSPQLRFRRRHAVRTGDTNRQTFVGSCCT